MGFFVCPISFACHIFPTLMASPSSYNLHSIVSLLVLVFVPQVKSVSHNATSPFAPPSEILGVCRATCVLEKGSGYPCPYTPTYPVWFWKNGTFNWEAPYRDGSTVELGSGMLLSQVEEKRQPNGNWQAQWYGGNHLLAPEKLHHVTHCACYYAKGIGMGKYWYLSNYGIKTVPESAHLPVDTVCPSNYQCPETNESAFEKWGPPWIEAYEGCDPVQPSVTLFA